MPSYQKIRLIIGLLLINIFASLGSGKCLDEFGQPIDLVGIPGPYAFGNYCRLKNGEFWGVGGQGQIRLETPDGKEVEQHLTNEALQGVYFVDAEFGWVVGTNGAVFNTTNGGNAWQPQYSGTNNDLSAVTCVDRNHCWVVGKNGTILKTVNGGINLKIVKVGESANFNAVAFINKKSGWIVGDEGLVLRTQDGGKTWQKSVAKLIVNPESSFSSPMDLKAVKFVSKDVGWVVGWGGVAKTTDGGKLWQATVLNENLIGVVAQRSDKLWLISASSPNYFSQDGGATWNAAKQQASCEK